MKIYYGKLKRLIWKSKDPDNQDLNTQLTLLEDEAFDKYIKRRNSGSWV